VNLTEDLAYKSSGTAAPVGDQKVFAYNTIDSDEKDHKAEQQLQEITDPEEAEKLIQQNDKAYKGMSNYTKYVDKKESNIKYVDQIRKEKKFSTVLTLFLVF
jgi:heme oxygenase